MDRPFAFARRLRFSLMTHSLTFLKNFLRHPTKVGAVVPSSGALAAEMVRWFDWDRVRTVAEFGPGTGVFTEAILERLHPDARFFAVERSPELAAATRQRCPQATVYEDSVTNVAALCRRESIEQLDAIICGLPWASFSPSLQEEIFEAMFTVLAPRGQFATFAYWQGVVLPTGLRFSRRLRQSFGSVGRSPTVWQNIPPAFIYRCVR